jgi:ornithine cyclodeaminase/alanine dehydrogenase-like protein (mu-crystallin family)
MTQPSIAPPSAARDPRTIRYLSRADVEGTGVTIDAVIEAVETGFREKGHGRVEMPPKPGVHPGEGDNFIHAMPASIPGLDAVGIKWISGFPGNQALGLPYITGLLILNDPATGIPISVMDATWITGVRTAAASAVSARCLARPDGSVLAILACGVQGSFHVDALRAVLPGLTTIRAFDPDPARVAAFAAGVRDRHGIEVTVASDPETAVRGADVIVTSGPILRTPHASIKAGWMAPGAFASAVDFDSYWDPAALAEIDLFATDDIPQLEHFREMGYFRHIPPIAADLGQLVVGARPGRTSPGQRTMACNLGLALDDIAVAPLVLRAAEEKGLGVLLPL